MHQFFLKHVEPLFSLFHHPLWCHNSASSKSLHIWCQLLIILMLVVCGCSDASSDQLNPVSLLNDEAVVLAVCLFCKHNRVTPPPSGRWLEMIRCFHSRRFYLSKLEKAQLLLIKWTTSHFCRSSPVTASQPAQRGSRNGSSETEFSYH